jgi:hypothetical protein
MVPASDSAPQRGPVTQLAFSDLTPRLQAHLVRSTRGFSLRSKCAELVPRRSHSWRSGVRQGCVLDELCAGAVYGRCVKRRYDLGERLLGPLHELRVPFGGGHAEL